MITYNRYVYTCVPCFYIMHQLTETLKQYAHRFHSTVKIGFWESAQRRSDPLVQKGGCALSGACCLTLLEKTLRHGIKTRACKSPICVYREPLKYITLFCNS